MSYCKRDGKDVSIFVTKEDIDNPETVTTLAQDEMYGIVLPNGELNWDCPCLGGMAYGPCGQEFRDAFSCFHYSEEEEKGSDCIPQFRTMQECFEKHPDVYGKYADVDVSQEESGQRQEEGGAEGESGRGSTKEDLPSQQTVNSESDGKPTVSGAVTDAS